MVYNDHMKLVMHYIDGDGCTYWSEVTYPFEYASAEDALVDFEALFKAAGPHGSFHFAGENFICDLFIDHGKVTLPTIYTLEEWFEAKRIDG